MQYAYVAHPKGWSGDLTDLVLVEDRELDEFKKRYPTWMVHKTEFWNFHPKVGSRTKYSRVTANLKGQF